MKMKWKRYEKNDDSVVAGYNSPMAAFKSFAWLTTLNSILIARLNDGDQIDQAKDQ